jgi:hypothetical protein
MEVRRDPVLRTLRMLAAVCVAVLFDLDVIWGQGRSLASWVLRVVFAALIACTIAVSRTAVDRVRLDDKVIARAVGRRDHVWQGAAVFFTAGRVVALRRNVIAGTIRGPLIEADRSTVRLYHERHGAIVDHLRCDWPDGTVLHLRVRRGDMRHLSQWVEPADRPRNGPLARSLDWVRAGTTYEE